MKAKGALRSPFSMALTGDVMLGRGVNDVINLRWFAYPWGDALGLLHRADLRLVNLECALTAETRPARDGENKAFRFRADPAIVETNPALPSPSARSSAGRMSARLCVQLRCRMCVPTVQPLPGHS